MLTLTITANYFFWASLPLSMFLYGKCLQQGGVKYARGQNWYPETLLGLVIFFSMALTLGLALMVQNAPPEILN